MNYTQIHQDVCRGPDITNCNSFHLSYLNTNSHLKRLIVFDVLGPTFFLEPLVQTKLTIIFCV